jgi:DNA-binding Lrp family transcriptional regulator
MYSTVEEGGEAYILLKVEPRYSEFIARKLSELPEVDYAAAVFGQWDIITHVRTGSASTLIHFLAGLQHIDGVKRTETLIVRADQLRQHPEPRNLEGHWAFLFLRLPPRNSEELLIRISRLAEGEKAVIQHAAGTLGPYDFTIAVRYSGEDALRKLVMDSIQDGPVEETITMTAIQRMVFRKGVTV